MKKKIIFDVIGKQNDDLIVEIRTLGMERKITMPKHELMHRADLAFDSGFDVTIYSEDMI